MAIAPMTPVEIDHIAREQLPHALGDRLSPCPHEEMKMIGHQGPSIDDQTPVATKGGQAIQEIIPVSYVAEDLGAFDPSADEVMQGSGGI